ncbi:MAG: hypothetical protein GY757_22155, partial [bacterium]|nr:hypothetical protein [bacterium]
MKHTHKTGAGLMLITASILLMFSLNTFAAVWYNSSTLSKARTQETLATLDSSQIEGAGHFLKAYSGVLYFLQKFELAQSSEADFAELQNILEDVIFNLETTVDIYSLLKAEMETMLPNRGILTALSNFNYEEYCRKHNLNSTLFRA